MKLTDEALDYPDAMPPRADNSIETPPEIAKMIEDRKAARAASVKRSTPAE